MAETQAARSGFLPDPEDPSQQIWWEAHEPPGAAPRGEAAPSRETVCLLNGLAMHTKAWYPFLDELAGYRVVLFDYLGQGASSSPDQAIGLPRLAHQLARVLDELGVEEAHVLGVSYGGFVALEFARLHTQRLASLTLSGILLSRERIFELYQAMSLRFYAGGRALFPLYTHYLYEKIFGESFLRATSAETFEAMRQRFEERYQDRIHSLRRLTEAQDPFFAALEENLPAFRAMSRPTLVLAGEQDRTIPIWAQRQMAQVFPQAHFELIPDAGHVVYLEQRQAFFTRFRRFLASRDPHS